MAGHSKWANIQHRKKAQDAKRGKLFTRLIREVTIAARMGGDDVEGNPRLRAAVDSAKAANMPNDTIARAIKRGAGGGEDANVEEVRYEGYGPSGVAIMVECVTDNRNRTVADVRHAFSKRGGNLGTDGSVAYLFTKIGQIIYDDSVDEDQLMEVVLEAGAEDITSQADGSFEVVTRPETFMQVKDQLIAAGLVPVHAEITMQPTGELIKVEGDDAEKLLNLLDMLEEVDDVQNVYSNADFPDELLG